MQPVKLGKAELLFFLLYFFVLQFISDVQYYLEFGDNLRTTIIYRLIATPFSLLPYLLFYKKLVPLLLAEKHARFILAVLLFIGFLDVYLHLLDWLLWNIPFLDDTSRIRARNNWLNPGFPRQSLWLTLMNLISITGFAYMINRWRQERALRELREQHLALELNYLKAQLHPHFFFNTLNNIYSLALYRSEKTAVVVAQLSELMRYVIYEGNKSSVYLRQEVDFLESYVQLERIRHEQDVPISFVCSGNTESLQIPPLLLMPLLENAFKHGFTHTAEHSWVKAKLTVTGKELSFEVKNSKTETPGTASQGIGLINLKKQLLLIYPGRHTLRITDRETQFDVHLTLTLS
ncbi:MAG TPA: histidine kinase [Flavisolibacter sp.]|nr:histidine kinase [Flavisolibacter sp.]